MSQKIHALVIILLFIGCASTPTPRPDYSDVITRLNMMPLIVGRCAIGLEEKPGRPQSSAPVMECREIVKYALPDGSIPYVGQYRCGKLWRLFQESRPNEYRFLEEYVIAHCPLPAS